MMRGSATIPEQVLTNNKIIFTNQKGGVGKSITCRECGFYLASREYDILIIDCDPQGSLSKSVGSDTLHCRTALRIGNEDRGRSCPYGI